MFPNTNKVATFFVTAAVTCLGLSGCTIEDDSDDTATTASIDRCVDHHGEMSTGEGPTTDGTSGWVYQCNRWRVGECDCQNMVVLRPGDNLGPNQQALPTPLPAK